MELVAVDGPDRERAFALSAQSVIGRDPTAAVHLTDEEVSRRHAIITVGEGHAIGQTVLEIRESRLAEDPENLRPTKVPLPRL